MDIRRSPLGLTLTECLEHTAVTVPASGVTIYTRHGGRDFSSYPELLSRSRQFAAGLMAAGCGPGERIGLLLPTSIEFFVAFFGCLFAGTVPVTLPVPARTNRLGPGQVRRLQSIVADADLQLTVVGTGLTGAGYLGNGTCRDFGEFCRADTGSQTRLPRIAAERIALVQYTSGSITEPKGVVLSHRNIVANVHSIARAVEMGRADTVNLWLPLFHDMGLIGSLTAIASQAHLRLCSPAVFLAHPLRWLQAFSDSHSTINASPHLFFRLLCEAFDPVAVACLDLSSWRVAFNGSETVHAEEIDAFVRCYGQCGFRSSVMYPVYGLAEATLAAAFPVYGAAVKSRCGTQIMGDTCLPHWRSRRFVSVGRALEGHEIQVVPCPDAGQEVRLPAGVGEVLIKGPSVMQGYLNAPDSTRAAIIHNGWLHTGDLGIIHEDELYLCGRQKEIVVVHGANYFPADFEAVVRRMDKVCELPLAGVAAFADCTRLEETVGVALEIHPLADNIHGWLELVRGRCARELGVDVRVMALPHQAIPRTTSGKVRRLRLAELLQTGELTPLASVGPGLQQHAALADCGERR